MPQAKYQVHAFCNKCGEIHNMYIGVIRLYNGPLKKESIADTFEGKELSSSMAVLTSTKFICPKTKRFTLQEDNNKFFLVPFLETDQGAIDSKDRGVKKRNSLYRVFPRTLNVDNELKIL